jgi:hypothetical protein
MSKKQIMGLLLIGLLVVVLVFNRKYITVYMPFDWDITGVSAFVYLVFIALGVVIGILMA